MDSSLLELGRLVGFEMGKRGEKGEGRSTGERVMQHWLDLVGAEENKYIRTDTAVRLGWLVRAISMDGPSVHRDCQGF